MMIVYVMILVLYIALSFISARHREKELPNRKKPFEEMGMYIYKKCYDKKLFFSDKAESHLKLLHPKEAAGKKKDRSYNNLADRYYIRKISLVLLLIFIGDVSAIVLSLNSQNEGVLTDGRYIQRNTYGAGSIEADLQAKIAEGEEESSQEFCVTIHERKYEREEVHRLAEEVSKLLPDLMLNGNASQEEIRSKLNLARKIEGYPFRISWDSDNYELVYTDGTVINEQVEENGELVNLTAVLAYDDYREEHIFAVRILPPIYSEEEIITKKIYEALKEREELYGKEQHMELPDEVENIKLRWTEIKKDSSGYLFLLVCIGALGTYFLQDRDLKEKAEKRNRQMLLDYPCVISKLTLYMGAGMTIRNAFCKIANDYGKENNFRYVYEEMLITCYELDNGISETSAYENFGKRCRLPQYTKLSNILIQNLRKGSNGILTALRQEAVNAFEQRKNTAKKLGEEAGTKLLLPMMLMLGIVVVLIIVPAYFSFSI